MSTSRIPAYDRGDSNGMLLWFSEMAVRNLLFHPEDSPEKIIRSTDGCPVFTRTECREVHDILSRMFAEHGNDVIKACYPIFMRKAGFMHALDA